MPTRTRLRHRADARRVLLFAVPAILAASAATAQNLDANRVVDGSFESGLVSFSLPAVERFPIFSHGWASRGAPVPRIIDGQADAYVGRRFLRITSRRDAPVRLIQDLPVGSRAFEFEIAFRREAGSQSVRLLSHWDRRFPGESSLALGFDLFADGVLVWTPAGSWRLDEPLEPLIWHQLRVVSDPRAGYQVVFLDGFAVLALPGLPAEPPTTLWLGDGESAVGSAYGYDGVRVARLFDAELETLRADALADLSGPRLRRFLARLDAVERAQSKTMLTLPELSAARRLLDDDGAPIRSGRLRELQRQVDSLIALLRADLPTSSRR